jgi:hypothetical protein
MSIFRMEVEDCIHGEKLIDCSPSLCIYISLTLPHPILLNAARSSMRLRCGSRGGSDASSGGFGWVGAKIAPYFFDWVGPYLIS